MACNCRWPARRTSIDEERLLDCRIIGLLPEPAEPIHGGGKVGYTYS